MTALKELEIWRKTGWLFARDQHAGDVVARAWLQADQHRVQHGGRSLANGNYSDVLQPIEIDWLEPVDEKIEVAIFRRDVDGSAKGALDTAVREGLPEYAPSHVLQGRGRHCGTLLQSMRTSA